MHVVGLSILSGSHRAQVAEVLARLRAEGLDDVPGGGRRHHPARGRRAAAGGGRRRRVHAQGLRSRRGHGRDRRSARGAERGRLIEQHRWRCRQPPGRASPHSCAATTGSRRVAAVLPVRTAKARRRSRRGCPARPPVVAGRAATGASHRGRRRGCTASAVSRSIIAVWAVRRHDLVVLADQDQEPDPAARRRRHTPCPSARPGPRWHRPGSP